MKVTFTQSRGQRILNGWILIRIETHNVCTEIWTSSAFNPYPELYTWLGRIRDKQIPTIIVIDEECRRIQLIAEDVEGELLNLNIEPFYYEDDETRHIFCSTQIDRCELVKTFCDAIVEFIKTEYQPSIWSMFDDLSNLNWKALSQSAKPPSQNWDIRLGMYGGGRARFKQTNLEQVGQNLTIEQLWLSALSSVLYLIGILAKFRKTNEIYALVSLYKHLTIDLALGELDPSWYEERRADLDREFDRFHVSSFQRSLKRYISKDIHLNRQARLATLKVGQMVDGTISAVKPYGLFVNIGGYHALLHISAISQLPIEHPEQVFHVDDWVRAMIIAIDYEKGRVSLSTSDLEPEPGDMLKSPLLVYEKAEEMAERYRTNVLDKLGG